MYAADHAQKRPSHPAIIMAGSGVRVTFAEYEASANRLAHLFRHAGLSRLGHVAQFMENHPRYPEAAGAGERTGLYYTLINSHLSLEEVAYIVNDCDARVLISSHAKRDIAQHLPARCPRVERFLMMDGVVDGWESYEDATSAFPAAPVADEQLGGAMLYSSGTTGRPKGVLKRLAEGRPDGPMPIVGMMRQLFGFRDGMVYLSPAPLYHSAPQIALGVMLRTGTTTVVMERFDPEAFLEAVERYRVTHTQVVPTMLIRLLRLPEDVRSKYDLSSLESIVHAGAPCPVSIKEEALNWLGPIISEYYGATEGHGLTWCGPADWMNHKGSVGRPVLGQIEIRDDNGDPCPAGTPGVVWFRGATDFEYFNDPEKTAASRDATGAASTVGDIGYLDADGFLYLTDRASHMIISGGVNIYPQETENLLASHPKVADVAVIGVPHEEFGEEVKAVVRTEPGVEPSPALADELIMFCRDNLSHYKCPRSVDFVETLPRSPTGKLHKRLLRDQYWDGDKAI